ncbi:Chromo domain-containing protein [Fusarium sp. LHS14.1]|nr:Chromo domain-containing protein [Fusarium sp. LHS14.1]
MMDFWFQYQRTKPNASVHELQSLKDFVRQVAYGIDGEDAEDQEFDVPGWETVRKYWNAFTAAWQRAHPLESIPRGLAQSVTEATPKDLTFVAFINENGAPEFAIQLTRDAKNMTSTPNKRPQHALYEGSKPEKLCYNPMLPFLARLLAYEAFRDYKTIDELLTIVPPKDEMWVIQWKEHLLETPFFRSQSSEDIETAGAFSHRLRSLGLRAGYPIPPRHHDIRAEGLYLMSQNEPESTRMVYAGHAEPKTLGTHYLPRNGADGQAAYHGQERRTLVLDLFRGLTIPRNPSLWQCLPAKQQYECDTSAEMMHIKREILALQGTTNTKSQEHRKKLYAEKRKLVAERLRKWQRNQPVKHDDQPGYHRAIFDRVRFLMPERDRLAHNLFLVDKLRSPAGLTVLHDMLGLYQKRRNVEYRPGLEPDKCHCGKDSDGYSYDWRHIYDCHRTAAAEADGFAELCFLCNDWFCGIGAWETHCQHHLDHPDSLPTWCDPLAYGGVLARAGYCPFCLGDERMPASARMYQFKKRWTWLDHIQTHIRELENGTRPLNCPRLHSHCPGNFESILDLRFHLQDAFGVERNDNAKKMKRPRRGDDGIPPSKRMRVQQFRNNSEETDRITALQTQYTFHHTYPDGEKRQSSPESSGLCQESTPFCSSDTADYEDAAPSGQSTPLSSAPFEEVIDPAMSLVESWPGDRLTGCTAASGLLEATPDNPQEIQDPLQGPVSAAVSVTEETGVNSTTSSMDTNASFQDNSTQQVSEATKAGITPDLTSHDGELIGRVPIRDNQGEESHDKPLPLDQAGTEFEVESLVAKGRIGRRVWYKVKWKGYPESDNSWVKKRDIGTGATANYEAKRPCGRDEFKFEALVSKKEIGGVILYEAKWRGQPSSENMWVDKWDVGAKAIAAFETSLSTQNGVEVCI